MNTTRVAAVVGLLVMVAVSPYWLYLPLIVVAILYFPFFVEGIVLGFIVDALYGPGGRGFFLVNFPFAFMAAVLVLVTPLIQRRLRLDTYR